MSDLTELEVPTTVQIDTPPEEGVVAREKAVNPRDAVMAAAMKGRLRQLEAEITYGQDMLGDAQAPMENPPSKEAAPPLQEEAPAVITSEAPPVVAPAPSAGRVIKVDGREIQVTDEDLIRLAQTGLSSQQRYQEAARMRQEAEAMMRGMQQQPAPPQQQAVQQQVAQQQEQMLDAETAKAIARRISYGSEDEQAQAILELSQRLAQPSRPQGPSPEEIAQYAIQQAVPQAIARIQFDNNIQTIGQEFADIFNDRGLSLLTADLVNQKRAIDAQLQRQRPDMELYREAGAEIRARYITPLQATPGPQVPTDKVERKREAPKPLVPTSRVAKLSETREPSPADIVEAMRKARGQPSLR